MSLRRLPKDKPRATPHAAEKTPPKRFLSSDVWTRRCCSPPYVYILGPVNLCTDDSPLATHMHSTTIPCKYRMHQQRSDRIREPAEPKSTEIVKRSRQGHRAASGPGGHISLKLALASSSCPMFLLMTAPCAIPISHPIFNSMRAMVKAMTGCGDNAPLPSFGESSASLFPCQTIPGTYVINEQAWRAVPPPSE